MKKAQIKFYGVRGSLARPGLDTLLFGGNTACVEIVWNKKIFIIDTGTGAFELGRKLAGTRVKATVLFTHYHWDHIIGLPFFSPIHDPRSAFELIGMRGLKPALARLLSAPNFPVRLKDLKARIKFREIKEGAFAIEGVLIDAFEVNHPNGAFGYRFFFGNGRSVALISDNGPSQDDSGLIDKICGADILIHDAQYLPREGIKKKRFGHSTYNYVLDLARKACIRKIVLFHHDPSRTDAELEDIEKKARGTAKKIGLDCVVSAAREGTEINL